jgi:hypothetical protein
MEFTDSILFTTTCEGKITNLAYKKEANLVVEIIKSLDINITDYTIISKDVANTQMDIIEFTAVEGTLRIPNVSDLESSDYANSFIEDMRTSEKNSLIDSDILSIGCNYGEFKSNEYIKLTTPIKKSNRGRKKKTKRKTTRKRIGNGDYFNSQITFTLRDPIKLDIIDKYLQEEVDSDAFTLLKSCMYHVKIYTNGKFQVPFVRDEDVTTVLPVVKKAIDIVSCYKLARPFDDPCEVEYIKSIMKNYRFCMVDPLTLIDIKQLKRVIILFKEYSECIAANKEMPEEVPGALFSKDERDQLLEYFNLHFDELTMRKVSLVKYNSDNYTGFVVKFLTPIDTKATKETTAAIFDSNKINLYGSNCKEEANIIKNTLKLLIASHENCTYMKD